MGDEINSEQLSQNSLGTVELPSWIKTLFRVYSIALFVNILIVAVSTFSKTLATREDIVALFSNQSTILYSSIFLLAVLFIFCFEVLYIIGIFKNKKWVLPVVLVFAAYSFLSGVLFFFHDNESTLYTSIFVLLKMMCMGIMSYVSIKYWSLFEGSGRKLLLQVPLLLSLLPFALLAILSQVFVDDKTLNDSDLVLGNVSVLPESSNAFYSLPKTEQLLGKEKQDYESAVAYANRVLRGEEMNNAEAKKHILTTKSILADYSIASNKDAYQCPTTINTFGFDVITCSLTDIRSFSFLMSLRARIETEEGSPEKAIETSMSIIRMGNLLSSSQQPMLIEHLSGIAILGIGLESLEKVANSSAVLDKQYAQSVVSELNDYILDGRSLEKSIQREYLDMKESVAPFEKFSSYVYQYNKTINQYGDYIRMQIAISTLACGGELTQKTTEIKKGVEENQREFGFLMIISPNSIGNILNNVTMSTGIGSTVRGKECKVNELNQTVQKLLTEKL